MTCYLVVSRLGGDRKSNIINYWFFYSSDTFGVCSLIKVIATLLLDDRGTS